MNRVFIAVPINNDIIETIHCSLSKIDIYNKFKWEPKEKLHVTLKFIGEISESKIFTLDNILNKISENFNTFNIKVNRLGYFYKNSIPTIFWFNFFRSEHLNALKYSIENQLSEKGFEQDDKDFKAHVTLIRVKSDFEKQNISFFKGLDIEQKELKVEKILLMKSELNRNGSIYKIINEYKLK